MKKLLTILVVSVLTTSAIASVNQVLFDSNGYRKASGMMYEVCGLASTDQSVVKDTKAMVTKLGDYIVALDVERSGLSEGSLERTNLDTARMVSDRLQMLLMQNHFGNLEAKQTLIRYCAAPISVEN